LRLRYDHDDEADAARRRSAIGAVVLQWPIGYLSDYIGRRQMILIVFSIAVVVAVVGVGLSPGGWPILFAMFLFGGMSYPMY
jgi:MFS family permease